MMTALFANPWGLLALLGLPIVLAIHFLQHRTREVAVSTLFLLDAAPRETTAGRRIDRLVPSIPLWLQLLMVMLLALVLSSPRSPWQAKTRRLAVVIDDSASMLPAKADALDRFAKMTREITGMGARAGFLVLPANPSSPRIYAGDRADEARAAIARWEPMGGPVDPAPALRLARERVGATGVVAWLTDTPVENLPADAALVSVGKPVANVGITGVTFSRRDNAACWDAIVVNRGGHPESRQWHLEWDKDGRTPPATVALEPGQFTTIGGPVPAGATRLQLVLTPDAFPLDDTFPFVKPAQRTLLVRDTLPDTLRWLPKLLRKGVASLDPALEGESPDLDLAGSSDGVFPPLGHAILINLAVEPDAPVLDGVPVAARHALNDGLVWDGLAVAGKFFLPTRPGDIPLVWINGQTMISLRESHPSAPPDGTTAPAAGATPHHQLVIHFNPNQANLSRLPAAAILMLRFCEQRRAEKSATAWERVDPGQSLSNLLPGGTSPRVIEDLGRDGGVLATRTFGPGGQAGLHAPPRPGFFRVRDGDLVLLEGAVAFADGREGDFSRCAPADTFATAHVSASRGEAKDNSWWKPVVLGVLGMLLLSWYVPTRKPTATMAN